MDPAERIVELELQVSTLSRTINCFQNRVIILLKLLNAFLNTVVEAPQDLSDLAEAHFDAEIIITEQKRNLEETVEENKKLRENIQELERYIGELIALGRASNVPGLGDEDGHFWPIDFEFFGEEMGRGA